MLIPTNPTGFHAEQLPKKDQVLQKSREGPVVNIKWIWGLGFGV